MVIARILPRENFSIRVRTYPFSLKPTNQLSASRHATEGLDLLGFPIESLKYAALAWLLDLFRQLFQPWCAAASKFLVSPLLDQNKHLEQSPQTSRLPSTFHYLLSA